MSRITRRESIAALAAVALQAAPPAYPVDLVERHDESVSRMLQAQVTDPASPCRGGTPDTFGLHHAGTAAGMIESLAASFLCPQSKHHQQRELLESIRLASGFLERIQLPSGNINLLSTNFNSPPDTGFVSFPIANAIRMAQLHQHLELAAIPANFLRKAGAALAVGGVHTPNHRWVISEALAMIDEVLPDPRYQRRIAQWLAEGIDIDSDGQYTERSTSIYNTVVNRALTVLAIKLNRPELLEAVRRNLDAMQYLLHANGEVVTEISRRQDRNERGDLTNYWMPLRYLAIRDNNGRYATMANIAAVRGASLAALMIYPGLNQPLPAGSPLPDNFVKEFPVSQTVRWRRGATSATLSLAPGARIFSLHKGEAAIQAVRFASSFFGKGQFIPQRSEKIPGGWRLTQVLDGPYFQPFDPPRKITAANYDATRQERKQSEVCHLQQTVEVTESNGRFSLTFDSRGTDGVPLAVEISFRAEGTLDCPAVLNKTYAAYRAGGSTITFGPGNLPVPHTWTQIRGSEPELPGKSVYITGLTPFRHTLTFE